MIIPIRIPDELVRQAASRGVDVRLYVEQILEAVAAKPGLLSSPSLMREERDEILDRLAQHSDKTLDRPDSAFT